MNMRNYNTVRRMRIKLNYQPLLCGQATQTQIDSGTGRTHYFISFSHCKRTHLPLLLVGSDKCQMFDWKQNRFLLLHCKRNRTSICIKKYSKNRLFSAKVLIFCWICELRFWMKCLWRRISRSSKNGHCKWDARPRPFRLAPPCDGM